MSAFTYLASSASSESRVVISLCNKVSKTLVNAPLTFANDLTVSWSNFYKDA